MPDRHLRPNSGWLEVICGSMFSGKTEELLRRLRRAVIARHNVQLFKPAIDDRYGITTVASHDGAKWEGIVVNAAAEILDLVEPDTHVIAIDEVQFFDDAIIDVCDALALQGKRVIVAGLDMDFRGEPFGPMPKLMAKAESVRKLHAICMVCGGEASRTQRLINGRPAYYEDPVILIGAEEAYEARCRGCHQVPRRNE
ncbi:MAG TPA: thymidine kinase [Anaerolineae bacterium]|nr:thymidine kinase [Anaerolineae bacterium]HIQ12660.1 thymidine kinase [Caldilineales bacterium]